tara:strand:- start:5126 stop:5308 length:183 start_codon:yes stop_codon:yes gene_type:complete
MADVKLSVGKGEVLRFNDGVSDRKQVRRAIVTEPASNSTLAVAEFGTLDPSCYLKIIDCD